jgi:hypothetical protein
MKKTRSKKSRDTVPLKGCTLFPHAVEIYAGLASKFPSAVGNSEVSGKIYGLADCYFTAS